MISERCLFTDSGQTRKLPHLCKMKPLVHVFDLFENDYCTKIRKHYRFFAVLSLLAIFSRTCSLYLWTPHNNANPVRISQDQKNKLFRFKCPTPPREGQIPQPWSTFGSKACLPGQGARGKFKCPGCARGWGWCWTFELIGAFACSIVMFVAWLLFTDCLPLVQCIYIFGKNINNRKA